MPATDTQKMKLLHIMRILTEETDDEHGLTLEQILQRLRNAGISAERKSVYRDFDVLRNFGMDIRKYNRAPAQYALASRDLSLSEVNLLIDAVQSSRFLSDAKSDSLVRAVRKMVSRPQRKKLDKRVHVHGRPKSQAQSDFANVDIVQQAISARRKLTFRYYKLNAQKKKVERHKGEPYVVTPVDVVYSDGNYYMVAYHKSHDSLANYRIDRMGNIMVMDEPADKADAILTYDHDKLGAYAFGMYSGNEETVTLLVESDAISAVVDRFGRDVLTSKASNGDAHITARVMVSPPFFGWLAQFGTQVKVEKPKRVREAYVDWINEISSIY